MNKDNVHLQECISLSDQILHLLESDYKDLKHSLQGDVYEAYKTLVLKEIDVLIESRKKLTQCINFL